MGRKVWLLSLFLLRKDISCDNLALLVATNLLKEVDGLKIANPLTGALPSVRLARI